MRNCQSAWVYRWPLPLWCGRGAEEVNNDEEPVPTSGGYAEPLTELFPTEPSETPGIVISTWLFYTHLASAVADGLHITLPTPLSLTLARMLLKELDDATHGGEYPASEE
jgi:hypothetical protein